MRGVGSWQRRPQYRLWLKLRVGKPLATEESALRTVTAITLPRAKRRNGGKTGCARVQLTTLYPSLS